YLGKLSPIGEVRAAGPDRICATDFARLRAIAPPATFRYAVIERGGGTAVALAPELAAGGALCFQARRVVTAAVADGDPARIVTFEVTNGTRAGPLVIHTYELARGRRVVGVTRP